MILDLIESVALIRVESEDVLDQMSHFGGEVLGELQIDVLDAFVGLIVVVRLEWGEPATELETEDAQAPNVHSFVMGLLHYHLGREVIQRAAEGLASVVRRVDAPSEICYFDSTLIQINFK